jgi:triacylglycerol lipase
MSPKRAKRNAQRGQRIYPIVLVHGLMGFGTIGPRRRLEYFRGVMRHLENNAEVLSRKGKVYVADLDPTDAISSRAIQLRDFIQSRIYDPRKKQFRYDKVNIIAHSMGGLDARYMISNLALDTADRSPMAARVASLTTIGTPHLGSPFADFMLRLPIGQRIIQWANLYSIPVEAFEQLTVRWMVKEGFNERMPDREGVQYFSYAGYVPVSRVFPPMVPSAMILYRDALENDGLVPVESAVFRYGPMEEECGQVLRADHAEQIGHGYAHLPKGGFDHLAFYGKLANALDQRGLYFPREEAALAG